MLEVLLEAKNDIKVMSKLCDNSITMTINQRLMLLNSRYIYAKQE